MLFGESVIFHDLAFVQKGLLNRSHSVSILPKWLIFAGFVLFGGASYASCLSLGASNTGGISTESSVLINSCNVKIGYTYCVDSPGGGPFSCRDQKFGSGTVRGGGRSAISIMRNRGGQFRVYWYECQATPKNQYPMAVHGRFDGMGVTAKCG